MSRWIPEDYAEDPMVNAVLNLAAEMNYIGSSVSELRWVFAHPSGMSIAEEIHVALEGASASVSSAIEDAARIAADHYGAGSPDE